MGVNEIVVEGDVPAVPKRVFEIIADSGRLADWMPSASEVKAKPGPATVGHERDVTMKIHGMTIEAHQRVTESKPGTRFAWVHTTNVLDGKPLDMLANVGTRIELAAHGKGTRVRLVMHYEPKGIKARLAAPLITADVRKVMEKALENLRRLVKA